MRRTLPILLLLALIVTSSASQESRPGPIKPPPSKPTSETQETARTEPVPEKPGLGPLDTSPPPIPVDEIIQRFAAKEAEFRAARDNYTYTQSLRVRVSDKFGRPGGEYRRESEIVFTPEGRRYEKVTFEPPSTLSLISMSREDFQDIESIQPFVLTAEELPKYNITYQGRQQIDEVTAYVFTVSPKILAPNQRYFEGTIWVEDQVLHIVKSYGKAVPDLRSKSGENLFPKFETFREQIDGILWFPTYTRADDILAFSSGDVRIRMVIRYSNYRRFGSTSRIVPPVGKSTPPPPDSKPPSR